LFLDLAPKPACTIGQGGLPPSWIKLWKQPSGVSLHWIDLCHVE
jgi:hypothetical protein